MLHRHIIGFLFLLSFFLCAAARADDCRTECNRIRDSLESEKCIIVCEESARKTNEETSAQEQELITKRKIEEKMKRESLEKYVEPANLISWENVYDIEGDQYGIDIERIKSGGYAIGGNFRLNRDDKYQAMFMKISDTGEEVFRKEYSRDGSESNVKAITVLKGNKTLLAIDLIYPPKKHSNIYFLVVDSKGEVVDEMEIGQQDFDDNVKTVLVNEYGYIIYGGTANSFTKHKNDFFIAKMDIRQNYSWALSSGANDTTDGISSIKETSDSGYLATGEARGSREKETDMFVMKIDRKGREEWTFAHGSNKTDYGADAIEAEDGNHVAIGRINDDHRYNLKLEMIKFKDGDLIWERNYHFGQKDTGKPVTLMMTPDGNYVACGSINVIREDLKQDSDAILFKVDPDGNMLWYTIIGDPETSEHINDCLPALDGGIMTVGNTGAVSRNIMVMKIDDSSAVFNNKSVGP